MNVYSIYLIKMSSTSLKQKILGFSQRGHQLLEQLLQLEPLLRGSLARVETRCGKPNCWCAQSSKGHPHLRLTWSENGQMTTRKVPAQATERVQECTANYRRFRSLRRELLTFQARLQELLDQYEQSLIHEAQRPLNSLGFTSKMSPRTDRRQQKRRSKRKSNA